MRANKGDNMMKNLKKLIALLCVVIVSFFGGYVTLDSNHSSDTAKKTTIESTVESDLTFRNDKLLNEHYQKHGIDMGFSSAEEYQKAANAVIANQDALHKEEKEDGDDVYYLEDTNEFVIVSTDGYLRTYFYPNDGIKYYNRQ